MKKLLISIMILALLMAALFTGCSTAGKEETDTIKIGVASPFTGDYAQLEIIQGGWSSTLKKSTRQAGPGKLLK